MSLVLFWCAVVWFGVGLLALIGAISRSPTGDVPVRPLPWLILAALVALAFLARYLGY